MSITGAADGPPFRLGVAIADIVSGHVRGAGHHGGAVRARAHRPRPGGRHRDARLGGRAAHLSGRHLLRDRQRAAAAWATAIRPSCPTKPSAASDGDFVLAVGNDEQWRRFCAVAGIEPTRSGSRPTGSASPATPSSSRILDARAADPSRARLDRAADRGRRAVRLGARSRTRCSPIRRSRRATMMAEVEHADGGALRVLGTPLKLSDTPGAIRTAPPTLGQHTDAGADRRSRLRGRRRRRTSRQRRRSDGNLRRPTTSHRRRSSAPSAAPPSGARAPTKRRASTTSFLEQRRGAAVPAGGERAEGERLQLHRVHAGRQRPPDVGQERRKTTSSCRSTRPAQQPLVMRPHAAARAAGASWNPSGRWRKAPFARSPRSSVLRFLMEELEPFVER